MPLVYADINCFQRSFDDFTQLAIQMEAIACQEVFRQVEAEEIDLAWSFVHQDEAGFCPLEDRKPEVLRLSLFCRIRIPPLPEIYQQAFGFQQREVGLSAKDAAHLAAACYARSDFFLTCDKRFLKQARRLGVEPFILNPVEYVQGGH